METSEGIHQGDIIRDVQYLERATVNDGEVELSLIRFPLVIVLTQDCDLVQDHGVRRCDVKPDKTLISALVAPLYNAEHVFGGEHLEHLGIESTKIRQSKTRMQTIRHNADPRYHYVEFANEPSLVPRIIDFKQYFTANARYLEECKARDFVCGLPDFHREDVNQRFAAFLSRIALPSEPAQQ